MIGSGRQNLIRVALLCWTFSLSAHAEGLEFLNTTHYSLAAHEVESRELWLRADTIETRGRTQHHLFALGGVANAAGAFEKDLWLATRTSTVTADIRENARLLGGDTVIFNGRTGAHLMAAARDTVQLGASAVVGQDAALAGRQVIMQGRINGDARIRAAHAVIGGHVGGSLQIQANHITFLPGTRIGGNLDYAAPTELDLHDDVLVGGTVQGTQRAVGTPFTPGHPLFLQLYLFGAALVSGLVLMTLFPQYTGRAVRAVRQTPWRSALVGGIAFVLVPAGILLLAVTVIGLPAALAIAAGHGVLLYLSQVIVALVVGGVALRRGGPQSFPTAISALAIGLVLLYIVTSLPILRMVGPIVVLILGLGGMILSLRQARQGREPLHNRNAQEPPDLPAQNREIVLNPKEQTQ